MRAFHLLSVFCVFCGCIPLSAFAAGTKQAVVVDFEGKATFSKWPGDKPGEVAKSTAWKSQGKHALAIDPQLMTAIEGFKLRNWKGYDVLRIDTYNPSHKAIKVGFELRDKHNGFHERHDNSFSLPVGKHTIDIDISGDLWRGEENRPYIGKIKTPIDKTFIKRLAFFNRGDSRIYVDNIRVATIKKLAVPGGYAFDFGKEGTQVMGQYTGVFNTTRYGKGKAYGFSGATAVIGKSMSFPTPLLGDGIGFRDNSTFHVNLDGGNYQGLVVFERGGFWNDEQAAYTKAELRINQAVVHAHDYTLDSAEFMFQDVEITRYDDIMDKLIWPAHGKATFKFKARKGENRITLKTCNSLKFPLRIAGLVLAPDNPRGAQYIEDHIALQETAFARAFGHAPKAKSQNSKPVAALSVEVITPGTMHYPDTTPKRVSAPKPIRGTAIKGQTFTVQLGVYAATENTVTVSSALSQANMSYGVYMPMRPYGTGATWLEVSHYVPGKRCVVSPNVSRSFIVEYFIDDSIMTLTDTIVVQAGAQSIKIPINVDVVATELHPIPIPVGLFMNASYVDPKLIDKASWWRIQDSILREQMGAGLTALSGGSGLWYQSVRDADKYAIDVPKRYIELAKSYGTVHAIVPYGGFVHNLKYKKDLSALARMIKTLETKHGLPKHYLYAYDEPRSGTDQYKAVHRLLTRASKENLRTIGYTSYHRGDDWDALIRMTTAPAFNIHKAEDLAWVTAQPNEGAMAKQTKEAWVYNNGLDRDGLGRRLWQSQKLGVSGRMEWIGLFKQGYAFHNLDGREPSMGSFLIHKTHGVLKTPRWFSAREGLLDARIRYTLEAKTQANDPVLALWQTSNYRKGTTILSDEKQALIRQSYLDRLKALTK